MVDRQTCGSGLVQEAAGRPSRYLLDHSSSLFADLQEHEEATATFNSVAEPSPDFCSGSGDAIALQF